MIEQAGIGNPKLAAHAAKSQVAGAKHQATDTGGDHRSGTHGAWLESDVECGASQAVVPNCLRSPADGQQLRVGGGIVGRNRLVVRRGQQDAFEHDNRTHRHFPGLFAQAGFGEGTVHPKFIPTSVCCHSPVPRYHWSNKLLWLIVGASPARPVASTIEYMLRFIPLIFKNSFRNRRRSLLTVASMGASLCLLGVLFSLYQTLFLAEPSQSQALRLITRHRVSLTNFLPVSYEAKIRAIPNVREVTSWTWFGGTYKDSRDSNNFFARFAVEPDHYLGVRPDINLSEDARKAFLTQRTAAIATNKLAKKLKWKIGNRIQLTGDIFPVKMELLLVGLFDDPEGGDVFLFNKEYLREALPEGSSFRDQAGTYYILGTTAEAMPGIARTVDQMFDNSPQPTKTESEKQFQLSFASFLGNLKLFLAAICGAVTFTILLVSGNTMAMSVRERVREVGILKTLGFTSGEILGIILGEATIISFAGGVLGLLLASILVAGIRSADVQFANISQMSISPGIWGVCLGVAMVIGVFSAFVPAQGASRTTILNALRAN